MEQILLRTAMLLGQDAVKKLQNAHVTVFGAGGVGGYCIEALARSGVGHIHIVDGDAVQESNLNRQIFATYETISMRKVDAAKARLARVSNAHVTTLDAFLTRETAADAIPAHTDYIVDAIDSVGAKVALIEGAYLRGIPIISCMGMGNRLDPTKIVITDIYNTKDCPLARVMRHELRKRNIPSLSVAYSTEKAISPLPLEEGVPASAVFVPAAAGMALASHVVREIAR